MVRIQKVKPSLYAITFVRQTCKILKRLVICLNFKGDSVEHLSVTLDCIHNRGTFQLRNAPRALIVEGGYAEVAEGGRMEPYGCCCSITTPRPSALASVTSRIFLDPEIAASKSEKTKTLGLDIRLKFLGRCARGGVRTQI